MVTSKNFVVNLRKKWVRERGEIRDRHGSERERQRDACEKRFQGTKLQLPLFLRIPFSSYPWIRGAKSPGSRAGGEKTRETGTYLRKSHREIRDFRRLPTRGPDFFVKYRFKDRDPRKIPRMKRADFPVFFGAIPTVETVFRAWNDAFPRIFPKFPPNRDFPFPSPIFPPLNFPSFSPYPVFSFGSRLRSFPFHNLRGRLFPYFPPFFFFLLFLIFLFYF